MPTFHDPILDGAEASAALRGLAHATRDISHPAETYAVLGDLLGGVRSLRQVLDQLAATHIRFRAVAHDDAGDHAAGATAALAAADELHQAGTLLDAVHDRLDTAMSHSGRIAWHEAPSQPIPESPKRWVSVVFLEGNDADEVLDLINHAGTDAAIEHLAGHDYGEDTTQAALVNGYVYDAPPTGALDRVATKDVYTLTYNPFLGHVSLLRAHDALPDPALLDIDTPTPAPPAEGARRQRALREEAGATDWFAARPGAASSGRGLAL